MIQRLRYEGGVNGFHFCTLNLEKSTQRILETLNWAGIPSVPNKLIVVRIVIFKEYYCYMLIIKIQGDTSGRHPHRSST